MWLINSTAEYPRTLLSVGTQIGDVINMIEQNYSKTHIDVEYTSVHIFSAGLAK